MYPDLYRGLNLKLEDLEKYNSPLVGFYRRTVIPRGMIKLPVQAKNEVVQVNFIIVKAYSPYTTILARPWLHTMGVVSSTLNLKVKCPIGGSEPQRLLYEELERVVIGSGEDKYFQVGAQLPLLEKEELVDFLKGNVDVFAWSAYEAPGIDPNFICHQLNVSPGAVPRRQLPRHSLREHAKAIKEEVNKLKQAKAIKEAFYPEWLANTVVVKKKNGKWRVCVDFTDLNKVCPEGPFLVPRIDQLVDATIRHPQMSFLDAFQGVSPNTSSIVRPKEDSLSNLCWELPLSGDAFWPKECGIYVLEYGNLDVRIPDRADC
nr:uncharacterized protein LOC112037133 [Quercus suber]